LPPPSRAKEYHAKYNLDYLRSVSCNNREYTHEMITTFLESMLSTLDEMQISVHQSQCDQPSRLAHQIKTSFTLMGLDSLRPKLLYLEENGKTGTKLDELPEVVDEFIGSCNQVLHDLSKEINVEQPC